MSNVKNTLTPHIVLPVNLKQKPNRIFPMPRGHLELLFKIISFGNPLRPFAMTNGKQIENVIIVAEYKAIFSIGDLAVAEKGNLLKYAYRDWNEKITIINP